MPNITTCTRCGRVYEAGSEEAANETSMRLNDNRARLCPRCCKNEQPTWCKCGLWPPHVGNDPLGIMSTLQAIARPVRLTRAQLRMINALKSAPNHRVHFATYETTTTARVLQRKGLVKYQCTPDCGYDVWLI